VEHDHEAERQPHRLTDSQSRQQPGAFAASGCSVSARRYNRARCQS
jgi:hypothetical protein